MNSNNNNNNIDYQDPTGLHKPFKIREILDDTIIEIENALPIANGTKKGYKVRLRIDFSKLIDYYYSEGVDIGKRLHLIFDQSDLEIIEVDRT